MVSTAHNDRRNWKRRQGGRRENDIKTIKIEGGKDSGQKVTVHFRANSRRIEKSTFGWLEKFTIMWSETYLSRNYKKS